MSQRFFYRKLNIIYSLKQNLALIRSPSKGILSVLKEAWTTRKWGIHLEKLAPTMKRSMIKSVEARRHHSRSNLWEHRIRKCSEHLREEFRVQTEGGGVRRSDRTKGTHSNHSLLTSPVFGERRCSMLWCMRLFQTSILCYSIAITCIWIRQINCPRLAFLIHVWQTLKRRVWGMYSIFNERTF